MISQHMVTVQVAEPLTVSFSCRPSELDVEQVYSGGVKAEVLPHPICFEIFKGDYHGSVSKKSG